MTYFSVEEFACPCCGENMFDYGVISMLDDARRLADTPFVITSGFRCEEHNESVGGKPTSSHKKGVAADIACTTSLNRMAIVSGLLDAGFTRIGVADTFIHVDYDLDKIQDVLWTY